MGKGQPLMGEGQGEGEVAAGRREGATATADTSPPSRPSTPQGGTEKSPLEGEGGV